MFRAQIYPKKEIFYTDNIRASMTYCLSGYKLSKMYLKSKVYKRYLKFKGI